SRTVPCSRIGRCSTSVTRRRAAVPGRTCAGPPETALPSSRTSPSLGRSSRARSRSKVLVPEPLGPTIAMRAAGGMANRSRSRTTRAAYRWRTPTSSSMTLALEHLQGDVDEQREHQQDDAERERQPEVALAGVERDGRGEGPGRAADVAADHHGGADLRDHVTEGGG